MRSKKAIYNIISNLMLQFVVVIYGFIVPQIIISNFGSSVNGLISSITQFLAYITLLESGFGPVVKATLYQPIAKKDNKTIKNILKASEKFFRTIAGIFIVYIIALTIIYPILVRNEFSNVYTISLILIIAISTFAEYFFGMTYRLYLQAEQKTYIISIIQVFTYILSTITIVILAKLNVSIQIIKLVSSIIFVLRPLLQNYYVRKKYNMNLKDAEGNYKIKQKWDGLAQHVAAVIHSNTDITILTFFCSLTEVSVYSVYYLVVAGIRKIIEAFSSGIDASWGDMIAKNEYKNLNEKFDLYEVLYFIVCTIVFASAIVLIVPFVSVYTRDINDANYIRYTFGYLIVISEFIWAIRLPYSSIILAAGHFKETRIGAWIEAISNIVISIVLVFKFGIIGVTIGTIVAMIIRTIEFIYHTNKYILKRNIFESIKKVFLIVIETIIIFILFKITPQIENTSYVTWSINAIIVSIEACIVTVLLNIMMYQKDMKKIFNKVKGLLARKEI
jgi:hypothetical protein